MGSWKTLDWQHGMFGEKTPSSLSKVSRIWLLLRVITFWTFWIERNNLTFNNTRWEEKKMQGTIGQRLVDYARIAWDIAFKESKKATTFDNMLAKFDMMWGKLNSSTIDRMLK